MIARGSPVARRGALVLLMVALTLASTLRAETAPLWEIGGGATLLSFPDYRGADRENLYLFPFPYLVYRGDFLKADKRGIRGLLFDSEALELNLSLNAAIPVSSSDNGTRSGMPDLKGTVEIGPSLDIHLWRSSDHQSHFYLRLPVRSAIAATSSPYSVGEIFLPQLNLDIDDIGGANGWTLGMLLGPLYASNDYNDYYYAVAPRYATATRPAYEARGGYGGMEFLLGISKRYPRFWVGGFIRYDDLHGAVFADSPLVRQSSYLAGGIAFSWILAESSQRVELHE